MKKLFILLLSVVCVAVYAKEEKFQSMDRAASKSHEMLKESINNGNGGAKAISADLKKQKKIALKNKKDVTYVYNIVSTTKIENNVADDRKDKKQKETKQAYAYEGNLTIKDSPTKNMFKYIVNGDFSIKIPRGDKKEYSAIKDIKLDKKKCTLVPYFESEAQKKAEGLVKAYYNQHKEFAKVSYGKVEPCENGYKITTTRTFYKDEQKFTGNEGTVIFTVQKGETLDGFKLLEQTEENLTEFDNTPAPVEPTQEEPAIEDPTTTNSKASLEDLEKISINGFKFNSIALSEENKEQLDQAAQILLSNSEVEIELLGHSCELGDKETNYNFGIMRAKEAKKYLVDKGIDAKRISVHSYGAKKPLVPNATAENRAQNRRVEIKVIK